MTETSNSWALTPFVYRRRLPPYVHGDLPVTQVTSKVPFAIARTGALAHRVKTMAAVTVDGRLHYGARWVCGGGSTDVVPIHTEQIVGDRCTPCELNQVPVVYRCFAKDGRLLYVGSTGQRWHRMKAHEANAVWWAEMDHADYAEFPSLTGARAAERIAIREEHPLHNASP